jgi:hypothetical protein
VLNFYQINRNSKIQIRDHLVIKALIQCQRIISTQKLKLLGEVPIYDLYYSLTIPNMYTNLQIDINKILICKLRACLGTRFKPYSLKN